MTYWHGSGRVVGDWLLAPEITGVCRSGDDDSDDNGYVFITPLRSLALSYASTTDQPWLYEVEPVGPIEQDDGSMLPAGDSMRCLRARIVRRYKPSNAEVARYRSVLGTLL